MCTKIFQKSVIALLVFILLGGLAQASTKERQEQIPSEAKTESGADEIRKWVKLSGIKVQIEGLTGDLAESKPKKAIRLTLDAINPSLRGDAQFKVTKTRVNKRGMVSISFMQKHGDAIVGLGNSIQIDKKGRLRNAAIQVIDTNQIPAPLITRTNADAVALQYVQSLYMDTFDPNTSVSSVRLVYNGLVPYWEYYNAIIGNSDDDSSYRPINLAVNALTSEVREFSNALYFASRVCTPDAGESGHAGPLPQCDDQSMTIYSPFSGVGTTRGFKYDRVLVESADGIFTCTANVTSRCTDPHYTTPANVLQDWEEWMESTVPSDSCCNNLPDIDVVTQASNPSMHSRGPSATTDAIVLPDAAVLDPTIFSGIDPALSADVIAHEAAHVHQAAVNSELRDAAARTDPDRFAKAVV